MALEETHLELSNPSSLTRITSSDDYAICHQIMLKASNNYSFASKFLPSEKRHHVDALYAFLRIGDDRVDVSHEGFASPLQAIEAWEKSYWRAFEHGESDDPVIRAYINTAVENGIPAITMTPYFRAMKEDLIKTRFATFDELLHYMDGSAVPVGRAMTYILGVREPYTYSDALERADYLSIAMQMSNFWRDIGQDWGIGRVYLPQEDMELFGVREEDLAAGQINDLLIELLEFEIGRTEHYYSIARSGIPMLASGRWGVMSSMLIYQAILNSIRENKYDVFSRRARTNGFEKARLLINAWKQVRISSHGPSS
jgi:phytoene synthase